jgi:hypothetical protein
MISAVHPLAVAGGIVPVVVMVAMTASIVFMIIIVIVMAVLTAPMIGIEKVIWVHGFLLLLGRDGPQFSSE